MEKNWPGNEHADILRMRLDVLHGATQNSPLHLLGGLDIPYHGRVALAERVNASSTLLVSHLLRCIGAPRLITG